MDKRVFWVIIEATLEESCNDAEIQEELIKKHLLNFKLNDIYDFQQICLDLLNGICTMPIHAAAFVVHNSLTADSFKAFGGWLISQGEQAYMNAVDDADSIYDLLFDCGVQKVMWTELSIDLLAFEVVREVWADNERDFDNQHKMLLNNKKSEIFDKVAEPVNPHQKDRLMSLVPRLVSAFYY
jgi:hypothetical protein